VSPSSFSWSRTSQGRRLSGYRLSPRTFANNGYRFTKREGESIPMLAEKCLKIAGFCDFAVSVGGWRSDSIHRDA
jgi:hypothetical protein